MHPKCLVTEPKQPQKLRRNSKQTQKPPKKEDKKKKLAPGTSKLEQESQYSPCPKG